MMLINLLTAVPKNRMRGSTFAMLRLLIIIALISSIALFVSYAQAQTSKNEAVGIDAKQHKLRCEFDNVVFDSNFSGGRISACSQLSEGHYLIETHPENTPINPSPWYAFSVDFADKPASDNDSLLQTNIKVSIKAENSRARYLPKINTSINTQAYSSWSSLPFDFDENAITIEISARTDTQYIAAQEILGTDFYAKWNQHIADNSALSLVNIGKSLGGRALQALVHEQANNNEWILIIGRQHPPELTGAMAMLAFTETLIKQAPIYQDLFARFNLLIVPLINPDGVEAGNWRHNMNGIDLNRDWGKFTQPETQVVEALIKRYIKDDQQLVFALDFHSTQQNIFYTMPTDYIPIVHEELNINLPVQPTQWVNEWLDTLKEKSVRSFVIRNRPGTSPGRGVFKQYIADAFAVHAVTYEIGDNTDRALIAHVAEQSAKVMAEKLISTPKEAFLLRK